jgi:pyrroloquinoline quinone biosynthesis protein B
MGHLPQSGGPTRPGMVDVMNTLGAGRKVLIHINNSNPILDETSVERRLLDRHGIEVAYDGMEITL